MIKQLTISLSEEVFDRLNQYVEKGCLNRSAFLEKIINDFLNRNPIKELVPSEVQDA